MPISFVHVYVNPSLSLKGPSLGGGTDAPLQGGSSPPCALEGYPSSPTNADCDGPIETDGRSPQSRSKLRVNTPGDGVPLFGRLVHLPQAPIAQRRCRQSTPPAIPASRAQTVPRHTCPRPTPPCPPPPTRRRLLLPQSP